MPTIAPQLGDVRLMSCSGEVAPWQLENVQLGAKISASIAARRLGMGALRSPVPQPATKSRPSTIVRSAAARMDRAECSEATWPPVHLKELRQRDGNPAKPWAT